MAFLQIRVRPKSLPFDNACAIATDDRLYCWGRNASGELGDGNTTRRLRPTLVKGGHKWRRVAVGADHTCGIRTNRTLACWGANDFGQSSAIQGTYLSVTGGIDNTCGIRANGVPVCWGGNNVGQSIIPPGFG